MVGAQHPHPVVQQFGQGGRSAGCEVLEPGPPAHPWTGRRFTASRGNREPLAVALATPELVAEVSADAAADRGKWRHPVRWVRLRANLSPADAPRFGQGNQPSAG
ncbi:hypothetical protein GCM10010359_55680 [Streptomyces morookaense]|nr:hypothetical protein GCM10010359_55680 [Streptomyces morookaense]